MNPRSYVVSQFASPRGLVGRIAGWIMARRPSNRARNLWTLDLLAPQPEDRVLELGFGPGVAIERVASVLSAGEVVGVDHSPMMLRLAAARNRRAIAGGRVRLLVGSAEQLPPELGRFDRIFSTNVVQFWPEPTRVFERLFERLAPGGMVATTYQPRHRGARPEDAERMANRIAAWMADAGFAEIRRERLELRAVPAICVVGRRPES